MKRTWLKASVVAVLSAAGWLVLVPQPAQAQVIGTAAGVWGWRNIVAPRFGGPWVAPDVRFRPFDGYVADSLNGAFAIPETQALVMVKVPDANAQVWIQGRLMQQTGQERVFTSPPLEPGINYNYEIRARWRDGNQTMDQTRTVPIRPGQQVNVDFSRTVENK